MRKIAFQRMLGLTTFNEIHQTLSHLFRLFLLKIRDRKNQID